MPIRLARWFGVMLLLCAAVGAGCAGSGTTSARVAPLTSIDAATLGCTPLMLMVQGEGAAGAGSGVLVHPRVIVTAEHVVPEGARSVMAFVDGGAGEAVRIELVVRGTREGFWNGDWALIVLAEPFGSLRAQVATRMAAADQPIPSPGDEVVIAGFPIAGNDPMERSPVVITTRVMAPPPWVSRSEDVFFAYNTRDDAERPGASGSPVFAGGVLIGVYSGTADAKVLGIRTSRHLVIQRLPTGAAPLHR
jgi:hypothetical protein